MSLIHDALKKAQGNQTPELGSGLASFQEPPAGEGEPAPKRTIILIAVLAVAVIFFVYMKFFSKPKGPQPKSAAAIAASMQGGGQAPGQALAQGQNQPAAGDLASLKKKAVDSFKTDDLEGAWAALTSASQIAATDPEVWNNFGLVAKKRGDPVKAREAYNKALELKPDYPEALNNLAVLERDEGNGGKSRELLDRALKILPAYPEANFNMALLYDSSGEKHKALEYYKRFLEIGGSYPNNIIEAVRDRIMEIEPK